MFGMGGRVMGRVCPAIRKRPNSDRFIIFSKPLRMPEASVAELLSLQSVTNL